MLAQLRQLLVCLSALGVSQQLRPNISVELIRYLLEARLKLFCYLLGSHVLADIQRRELGHAALGALALLFFSLSRFQRCLLFLSD